MSDELNSQLSAFVDDELTPEESELFVRRLCRDETLRTTAACYGIIGDVLRGESAVTASSKFASTVMMALEGQTVPLPRTGTAKPGRGLPHWGFALAASVALAAVVLISLPGRGPDGLDTVVADTAELPAELTTALSANNVETAPVIAIERAPVDAAGFVNRVSPVGLGFSNGSAYEYNVPVFTPASAEYRAKLNNMLLQHINTTGAPRQPAIFRNVGFETQTESQR